VGRSETEIAIVGRMSLPSRLLNHPPRPLDAAPGAQRDSVPTTNPTIDPSIVQRIRGEFSEMPGFSPTVPQAARLFQLPIAECERVFEMLVREGFLQPMSDGRYRLASE
jgi:hypothetical protein